MRFKISKKFSLIFFNEIFFCDYNEHQDEFNNLHV